MIKKILRYVAEKVAEDSLSQATSRYLYQPRLSGEMKETLEVRRKKRKKI